MEVVELIKKVRKDNRIIKYKLEELERLENLCGVSGISFEEKVQGGSNSKGKENAYLNYIEYKDELEKYILQSIGDKKKLSKIIDEKVSETKMIEVMYQYCFENKTLQQIADTLHYGKTSIYRMYRYAIEEMERWNDKGKSGTQ